MVKGKGRVRARAHATQDPEYTLLVRGSRRTLHTDKNKTVDRPLTWMSFEARGIEVTVYLTPDQLRKHIAEAQAALITAEAEPTLCTLDHCYHCHNDRDAKKSSQTAEQGDS